MLTTDQWAIGCIYAELLSLRPIFKGDEAKLDSKKTLPFQRDQMGKICEVLGPVKRESLTATVIRTRLISSGTMAGLNQYARVQDIPSVRAVYNVDASSAVVPPTLGRYDGL